jgi:hypothetical protein
MCVQAVGMFTQSLFMPDSTQAASATVDGDVVLWDQALLPEQSMKVNIAICGLLIPSCNLLIPSYCAHPVVLVARTAGRVRR